MSAPPRSTGSPRVHLPRRCSWSAASPKGLAFTFFKPASVVDGKLSGQSFHAGVNGTPILDEAIAAVECTVKEVVELGDHHIVIGEVTEAYVMKPPQGRADAAILEMKDLGDTVYYGG